MFEIIYHGMVSNHDLEKIHEGDRQRVLRAIHKKLTLDPLAFGKPLQGDLKGCYRLRIDPYRVVYKINNQEVIVFIVKVGLRKDLIVYLAAAKRLKLISGK